MNRFLESSVAKSAVSKAASVLREAILVGENGAFLGSEAQLIQRLDVSRPTFRQVARLLAHEQLLVIKRGPGGGFYARWPSMDAVAHMVSIYLRVEQVTIEDGSIASTALGLEAARLASTCRDETVRLQFEQFLEDDRTKRGLVEATGDFLSSELRFINLLGTMSGNPIVKLVLSILYKFTPPNAGLRLYGNPRRIIASRETRIGLAEAVLSRDPEMSMLLWRRRREMQLGWLREEFGVAGVNELLFGRSDVLKAQRAVVKSTVRARNGNDADRSGSAP